MLKNFKCKRCGDCCRISPGLSRKDIDRIKKLGFKEEFFVEKVRGIRLMKTTNDKCIFLLDEGKTSCRIYKARPRICRLYPAVLGKDGGCKPEKLQSDAIFST